MRHSRACGAFMNCVHHATLGFHKKITLKEMHTVFQNNSAANIYIPIKDKGQDTKAVTTREALIRTRSDLG